MPKINVKKYEHNEGYELIPCPHCRRKFSYFVRWHYEDRPKKEEGRIIIPLKLMKTKCYDVPPLILCSSCKTFPRCLDCEIILCGWKKHYCSMPSVVNPSVCVSCWVWGLGKKQLSTV